MGHYVLHSPPSSHASDAPTLDLIAAERTVQIVWSRPEGAERRVTKGGLKREGWRMIAHYCCALALLAPLLLLASWLAPRSQAALEIPAPAAPPAIAEAPRSVPSPAPRNASLRMEVHAANPPRIAPPAPLRTVNSQPRYYLVAPAVPLGAD